jgi:hypothetical protein
MKKKDERLQIRVEPKQMKFLRDYSSRRNITISKMMRDFIDWLMRRDQQEGSNGDTGTEKD